VGLADLTSRVVLRTLRDGTKFTGPQEVVWGEEPIFGLLFSTNNELLTDAADTTWAFTALDRTGKDVAFTCVSAHAEEPARWPIDAERGPRAPVARAGRPGELHQVTRSALPVIVGNLEDWRGKRVLRPSA
jgi:hypothetical protein